MKYNCIRVYNNGKVVSENQEDQNKLFLWLGSNLYCRPGCALFVDGICRFQGYLTKERCEAVERNLAEGNPGGIRGLTGLYDYQN